MFILVSALGDPIREVCVSVTAILKIEEAPGDNDFVHAVVHLANGERLETADHYVGVVEQLKRLGLLPPSEPTNPASEL